MTPPVLSVLIQASFEVLCLIVYNLDYAFTTSGTRTTTLHQPTVTGTWPNKKIRNKKDQNFKNYLNRKTYVINNN